MNLDNLKAQLSKYYATFTNPKYKVGKWIIVNNDKFKEYKDKLKVESILTYQSNNIQRLLVAETKNKYVVIKWSDKFICFRESDTEYGLACDNYELLAINSDTFNDLDVKPIISFETICKIFCWKLSKKAKEYLSYFN